MQPGRSLARQAGTALAALAFACALAPALASAAAGPPADGDLTPRLAELATPSLRTAPLDEQAEALGVAAEGPGSLLREGGRILVAVRFERGAGAGVADLRAAGGRIVDISRRYQTATVAAKPADLRALAAVPRVESVSEILEPFTFAVSDCFGAATSEGDVQLGAMEARDGFELDGTGVTVGILSDSFDRDSGAPTDAAGDVASGDLPGAGNPCGRSTPVGLVDDTLASSGATDEGRAMAQIVHDLAPGAAIEFATAFNGLFDFAANIRDLAEKGADVIVDDVMYLEEPFFQEGPVAVAVSDVTEDGVAYFSSAGNNNLRDGGLDIASWETREFRDTSCPPALNALEPFEACMDFKPGDGADPTFEVTVSKGVKLTVDMQWAEPWGGVESDLDVYLLDSDDKPLPAASHGDNLATQRPFEALSWKNDSGDAKKVRLAITRCFGVCNPAASAATKPRLKFVLVQNGGGVTKSEYPVSVGIGDDEDTVGPTIFGHNGAEDAISVGAIRYNATSAPESFSSRGPVTHYFGPVSGTAPAAELDDPAVLEKPDLVATDGGANTFFGNCFANTWRFFGTSAAAPHAAAVAALQLQAEPNVSVADLKEAQRDTADDVGLFDPTWSPAVGAGILDAPEAIDAVSPATFPGGDQTLQQAPQNCGLTFPEEPTNPANPASPAPVVAAKPAASVEDRTAPRTFFRRKPARVVRTGLARAMVVFRFGSNEDGVRFFCRVDGGLFRACGERFARRFAAGPHTVRVKARDAAGNVDRTPAEARFRVERVGGS